jgi:uncharacterized protein (DUF302 family)
MPSMWHLQSDLMESNGIIVRPSKASVKTTINHFVEFLQNHGATIYARIDQQAEAQKAGVELRPLEFLLFGNPAKGAQLMKENILSALDLPLKIIAWGDEDGKTWVAFNDVTYVTARFDLSADKDSPLNLGPMVEYLLKNQIGEE